MINRLKILSFLLIVLSFYDAECSDSIAITQNKIFDLLNIPSVKSMEYRPVKIAVVDDGFRLTHNLLKDHIYTNSEEILGNYRDDDGNGIVDDISGWDMSDDDNDVSVPKGKEKEFYHGTYIAGIIINIAKKFFGEDADKFIKIIPVKVRSDLSESSYFFDGYKGIKYAANTDADIILCSWSGGILNSEEKAVLAEALAKGKIIVSSVGNLWRESVDPPASFPGVIAVSGIDSAYRKQKKASFGMRVDLSAPGADILSAHPLADSAYIYDSGTSAAAATIAGVAAIMKSIMPDASTEEILEAK